MAVAPVDLAKIRLQLQQGRVSPTTPLKYRGMIQTMTTVAKEEGFLALWKGNIPAQLMVMTFVAIKFSAFNACRNAIERGSGTRTSMTHEQEQLRSTAVNLLAGGAAGAVATTGSYPMDVLRTRMASKTTSLSSSALSSEISTLWARSGVRGFYKGLGPSLMAIVPYMALQLTLFEAGKAAYLSIRCTRGPAGRSSGAARAEAGHGQQLGVLPSSVIGATAGAMSKLATLPLDLCKKRMQIDMLGRMSVSAAVSQIVRQEGILALWKGAIPAVIKTAPATAITYAVYEVCKYITLPSLPIVKIPTLPSLGRPPAKETLATEG